MKLQDAKMDIFYASGAETDTLDCQVRIGNRQITIAYEDDEDEVRYEGDELGQGHYVLNAPAVEGKATLHRFPEGKVFDGWWAEYGQVGMWRITLKD